jgi:hypothetical protein
MEEKNFILIIEEVIDYLKKKEEPELIETIYYLEQSLIKYKNRYET